MEGVSSDGCTYDGVLAVEYCVVSRVITVFPCLMCMEWSDELR